MLLPNLVEKQISEDELKTMTWNNLCLQNNKEMLF